MIAHTAKVWLPNGSILALVSLAPLESLLKVCLLLVSIAFTVWQWRQQAKNKRKEKNK
jgi:hypothetical protein